MAVFFDNKESIDKIKSYINSLEKKAQEYSESDVKSKIISNCCLVLNSILQSPSYWDKNCKLTLETRFRYIDSIIRSSRTDTDSVHYLFSLLFSLVMEKYFRLNESESAYFYNMRAIVSNHKDEFSESAQVEINHTLLEMPFDIVRENYHDSDIREFAKAALIDGSVKQYINEWSGKVAEQKEEVKALHEELLKQNYAFNFVSLYKGFNYLSTIKRKESIFSLISTVLLGLLAVLPLFFEIYMLTKTNSNSLLDFFKPATIPIITLTFIFIYYFRISLTNYQSIKSQIIQIELRKTLCTFIQKYSKYAKEMKTNDANSLEKFEAIIFSNIMPSEDKIPSTFDGIEQIAKLIESVKGK
ncbi:hypothetical protein I1A41_03875 [Pectobacterium carotovorum]|uniref:hypothetical protein n=1 Tax=Pectobacterium carotovorum TaxID=554 RepID=UPI001F116714|nr:hypothetical protein [Pectobacterium carotovorum]MCH4995353.1 hypothetical protein [Pectobacterium carotovorum]